MTALTVDRGFLPPTANYTAPRAGCDLDVITSRARKGRVSHALSLNFAFGGNNAALIIGNRRAGCRHRGAR